MNTQNSQNLKNCLQSEAFHLIDSNIERAIFRARCLIQNIEQNWADRKLATRMAKMSEKHLQDIGMDDPQVQIHQLGISLDTAIALKDIEKSRYLTR